MNTRQGAFGSAAGNRSHLLRSPAPYGMSRCSGCAFRKAADCASRAAFSSAEFLTALLLLYAASRSSRLMVPQFMRASLTSRLGLLQNDDGDAGDDQRRADGQRQGDRLVHQDERGGDAEEGDAEHGHGADNRGQG